MPLYTLNKFYNETYNKKIKKILEKKLVDLPSQKLLSQINKMNNR